MPTLGLPLSSIPLTAFTPTARMPDAPSVNWNIPDISGAFVTGLKGGLALGETISKPIAKALEYASPEATRKRDAEEKRMALQDIVLKQEAELAVPRFELEKEKIEQEKATNAWKQSIFGTQTKNESKKLDQEAVRLENEAEKLKQDALTIENDKTLAPTVLEQKRKELDLRGKEIESKTTELSQKQKIIDQLDFGPTDKPADGVQETTHLQKLAKANLLAKTFGGKGEDYYGEVGIKAPEGLNNDQIKALNQVRDDYNKDEYIKTAKEAFGSVNVIKESLSKKNGLGDIAAINAFQRMVDPGATVREGDVALIQSAAAFLAKMNPDYWLKKLQKGDKLPDSVRKQMHDLGDGIYKMRATNANDISIPQYRKIAKATNLPEDLLIQEFKFEKPKGAVALTENQASIITRMLKKPEAKNDPRYQEMVDRLREYEASKQ